MRLVSLMVLLATGIACQTQRDTAPRVSNLLGVWNVTQISGGPVQFGIELSRIEDHEIQGTLRRILSGNVELDVSGYDPIRGSVRDGRLLLDSMSERGQPLHFEFSLNGDSLVVIAVDWSGQSLVGPDRPWRAWRGD